MTSAYDARQFSELDAVAVALANGDWRTSMRQLRGDSGSGGGRDVVPLTVCFRYIGASMRLQSTIGAVEAAQHHLDTAERLLRERELWRVDVRPLPDPGVPRLAWTATQLIRRELADLRALRAIFGFLPRGRQELVYSSVEHLTWVEFDPWTVRVAWDDRRLVDLDDRAYTRLRSGNRLDLCTRATRLRQFADVRSGSVTERAWKGIGGFPPLREAALRVLSAEELDRGGMGLPVRLGRRRAWEYARQWAADVGLVERPSAISTPVGHR